MREHLSPLGFKPTHHLKDNSMGNASEAIEKLRQLELERKALMEEASDAIQETVENGVSELLNSIECDYIGVNALRRGNNVTVKVRTEPRKRNAYDPEDAYDAMAQGTLKEFAEEIGLDPRSASMAAKRWAEANGAEWPPTEQ